MKALAWLSTFCAVALGARLLWQCVTGRRRSQMILAERSAAGQRATVVRAPSLTERWEMAAGQAGLNWGARTYISLIAASIAVALLCALAGRFGFGLALVVAACLLPWALVRYQQRMRAERFAAQLPGALTLAANTIRAGGTMLQAVRAIARQMEDPIAAEFARVEQALHLQVPLPLALERAKGRVGAREFAAVVVAFKVAGQAGADLDVVLENIGREIVEERQFRDAMRAASSEGRMSAKVVTAIPFLAGGYFYLTEPHYFDPIMATPLGRVLLLSSFLAIGLGWFLISRITDVRNW